MEKTLPINYPNVKIMEINEPFEQEEPVPVFDLTKVTSYFMNSFTKYNTLINMNKINTTPVNKFTFFD
jgi:hypothetical protein